MRRVRKFAISHSNSPYLGDDTREYVCRGIEHHMWFIILTNMTKAEGLLRVIGSHVC